jgi:hypothetical protein
VGEIDRLEVGKLYAAAHLDLDGAPTVLESRARC